MENGAPPRVEDGIRAVMAVLNEGRANLETMNSARACLRRLLDEPDLAEGLLLQGELRSRLEFVLAELQTDGVELTRTAVVEHVAEAQAGLHAALVLARGGVEPESADEVDPAET